MDRSNPASDLGSTSVSEEGTSVRSSLPSVGIVGLGKVGLVLASAFEAAGYELVAVWDRSDGAERLLAALGHDVPTTETVGDAGDLLVVAVPDDVLPAVVSDLAVNGARWDGRTVLHVSGRYGADVLAPVERLGATTIAMHPAMAFTGVVATEVALLQGARFAVSGQARAVEIGARTVRHLGGVPVRVAEEDRTLYHAAIAHGCNHLVTVIVQAMKMLEGIGVDEPALVLAPAVRAALDNALALGANGATGPVVRGDVGTIAGHMRSIAAAAPSALPSYTELTRAGAEIAYESARIDAATLGRLMEVFPAH